MSQFFKSEAKCVIFPNTKIRTKALHSVATVLPKSTATVECLFSDIE